MINLMFVLLLIPPTQQECSELRAEKAVVVAEFSDILIKSVINQADLADWLNEMDQLSQDFAKTYSLLNEAHVLVASANVALQELILENANEVAIQDAASRLNLAKASRDRLQKKFDELSKQIKEADEQIKIHKALMTVYQVTLHKLSDKLQEIEAKLAQCTPMPQNPNPVPEI